MPSYDREEALDRMLEVFWQRGFAATSMSDLRAASGLGSRSLYADFGNKSAVFSAALERYRERSIGPLYEPLRHEASPLLALHAFIDRFETMKTSHAALGCLVGVGMAQSVPSKDPSLARLLANLLEEMRDRVEEAAARALDCGELQAGTQPAALAALLVAALQGIHLAGRVDPRGGFRADALSAAHQLLDQFST